MVIVNIIGGLGNQMFQYAFGRALAHRLGTELVLDISDFATYRLHNGFELDRVFGVQARTATNGDLQAILGWRRWRFLRKRLLGRRLAFLRGQHLVKEPHFHFAPEMRNLSDDTYVYGFWQSEKYFEDIAPIIRKDFSFRIPLSDRNSKLLSEIRARNSVSIHVRRGDYVANKAANLLHGVCSLSYYNRAIELVSEKIDNAHFYVFTDDAGWAHNNLVFPSPLTIVEHNCGEASFEDMRLMSHCQHHILANSSFSWWAAWLNPSCDKIVIAPTAWFADVSFNTSDLYAQSWIRL